MSPRPRRRFATGLAKLAEGRQIPGVRKGLRGDWWLMAGGRIMRRLPSGVRVQMRTG